MAELIISTHDGTITDTPITNSVLAEDDGQITIDDLSAEVRVTIPAGAKPIYSTSNVPIYSTGGIPLHEAIVRPPSDFSGYTVIGEALIKIDWSASGKKDLDCCAYWADNSGYKIGWSHGKGSMIDDNYKAYWTGDQTGDGPEYINLLTSAARRSTKEASPYQYKVHLNFWADTTGIATATVSVTFGGNTISKTIIPSSNIKQPATPSDPSVTITFDNDGTPNAIAIA